MHIYVRVFSYSQTQDLIGYNYNEDTTLYFPVLWVSEVSPVITVYSVLIITYPCFCVSVQHAELTPKFQQYLDDQGLNEVEMFEVAVPILFWVLGKSRAIPSNLVHNNMTP